MAMRRLGGFARIKANANSMNSMCVPGSGIGGPGSTHADTLQPVPWLPRSMGNCNNLHFVPF